MEVQFSPEATPEIPEIGNGGDEDQLNVVLRSVGSSSFSFIRSLSQLTSISDAWLSEQILRAPSVLFAGVPRSRAEGMLGAMLEAGLEVELAPVDVPLEEDESVCDLAIFPSDLKHLPSLTLELMKLLGVDAAQARTLLCSAPPVVLGGITRTTAQALEKRFETLGGEVIVSDSREAEFEIFVRETSRSVLQRVMENAARAGAPASIGEEVGPRWYRLCSRLTRAQADAVWEATGPVRHLLRVVDRSFLRYDVTLISGGDPQLSRDLLRDMLGISDKNSATILQSTPFVIAQNMGADRALKMQRRLIESGCQIELELNLFQAFSVVLDACSDSQELKDVLMLVAGLKEEQYSQLLRGLPASLEGPFTALQARWLHRELKRVGAKSRLIRTDSRRQH